MNGEILWAPWRGAYLRELARRAGQPPAADGDAAGFLADYWAHPERDEQHHVVYRDDEGMILLNRYPYANGHLLVALGDPRPTLLEYAPAQRAAFWCLVEIGMELMLAALRPQGVNVGINQGLAAGAGVPGHLHAHLVPRWSGDTNFITTVGQVRVIPEALEAMAEQYRGAVAGLERDGPGDS
ncbi:MAG: HIT family protein [Planctomycetota bacterium]|jgi:ATP adenylyltransferase